MKTGYIAAAIIVIIIIIVALFLLFYPANKTALTTPNKGSGSAPIVSQKFSQQFCVNGPGNATMTGFALSHGIECFRTDISLNPNEVSSISNESAKGAQYLGILDYVTLGAQPSQSGCVSGCNWTLATWNASVASAVANYPEVNEWEIYNEPLAGLFVSGYDNGSALNYFNMIRSASMIIKAKEPNATIVCFGGAQMYPAQSIEYEYPFYQQVWAYGASKYCDAISLHTYSLPYYNLNQTVIGNVTLAQFYNYTLFLYENLTGKPIWITETGITSNNWTAGLNLSQQKQASFLNQDVILLSEHQYVKKIYWFDLEDAPSGGQEYGLLNGSMQPKPAWYSFLHFVDNSTAQSN